MRPVLLNYRHGLLQAVRRRSHTQVNDLEWIGQGRHRLLVNLAVVPLEEAGAQYFVALLQCVHGHSEPVQIQGPAYLEGREYVVRPELGSHRVQKP